VVFSLNKFKSDAFDAILDFKFELINEAAISISNPVELQYSTMASI